jgi:hypothetical protein
LRRPRRLSRTQAWLLAAVPLAVLAGALVLWALPAWLTLHPRVATAAERHKAISDARTGILALLAVLGTVGGLAYTAQTYRLSRRGQVADRYTKAIEQLSHSTSDIRIGGIYALEQTARDAAEYRHTVIDVLAAYIRNRAPWPPLTAQDSSARRLARRREDQAEPVLPGADIHVALTVLRRLVRAVGKRNLDLSDSNLAGADLIEMYFLDARLTGANLTGTKLNKANMRGADLRGAKLEDAQLYKADLTDVILWRGQIGPESLKDADGLASVQWVDPPSTASTRPPLAQMLWRPLSRRPASQRMKRR